MDELDASMTPSTSTEHVNSADAAMAASHTHPPELSPTRVQRTDQGPTPSAEKPKKKKKACPSEASSEDDAAMAAPQPDNLPEIDMTNMSDETSHVLRHSMTARHRTRGMQALMKDMDAAAHPTPLPTGQTEQDPAADALAAAISATPRAAAEGSSPPRGHIRMAPPPQPAADAAGGWKVLWRGNQSASNSTDASTPSSPQRGGEDAGIQTSNRFEAISEEPRVRPHLSRGGRGGYGGFWTIVSATLAAMTATDFRGTNASHDWHDKPKLTLCQVTPFGSEELQGAWTDFEKSMGNHGMDESTLVDHAMKSMDFRERVLVTDKETIEAAVGTYLAARVEETRVSSSKTGESRQATINSWLTRNERIAQANAKRPETAPVIAVPDPQSADKAKGRYVMPKSATSQAHKAAPHLGPQGLRPQTASKTPQRESQPDAEPNQSPDKAGEPPPRQRATEAGSGGGVDGSTSEATDPPPPPRLSGGRRRRNRYGL